MEISWFLGQLLSKSAIRHSLGSTSCHPVTGIHDDHEAFMHCEWHNMTEPSGCFCQCNRNSVCRFCTVLCPNFGLVVIIYLSTPTVKSWWNQWLSIVACHSNSWWRWWCDGLKATVTLTRLQVTTALIVIYFPIVVVEISVQFLRYLWLKLLRLTAQIAYSSGFKWLYLICWISCFGHFVFMCHLSTFLSHLDNFSSFFFPVFFGGFQWDIYASMWGHYGSKVMGVYSRPLSKTLGSTTDLFWWYKLFYLWRFVPHLFF